MLDKGSKYLIDVHTRNKMRRLNKSLDEIEDGIITLMRMETPSVEKELGIHTLIGERERVRFMLKDLHNKLYA